MKSKMLFLMVVVLAAVFTSCSEDEVKRKGDPDVAHTGDKWTITSVDYILVDQSTSGQVMKTDTKANAGSFYFVPEGTAGSFEMSVEGYNKEDTFNYTLDGGSLNIFSIDQGVGTTVSQNVLAITGEMVGEEMTLSGTIMKQSGTTGQFLLTVEMTLTKD